MNIELPDYRNESMIGMEVDFQLSSESSREFCEKCMALFLYDDMLLTYANYQLPKDRYPVDGTCEFYTVRY